MEVRRGDRTIKVEAPQQRTILAALLLQANLVVSADALIDLLWPDVPPATARNTLHSLIRRLRRLLEPSPDAAPNVLATHRPGYILRVEPEQVDLYRFEN